MDCCWQTIKKMPGLYLVSTTDYFYPLVDDPYIQGRIGAANVLSDLYAMGISECENVLMILGASNEMPKEKRDIVTKLMVKGFNDTVKDAGSEVTGGQSVLNPWPIIGGTATAVCSKEEMIIPENAIDGDVLILTKPLGIQVAVNLNQWRYRKEKWETISHIINEEEVEQVYQTAIKSMIRLNINAAQLMHKYGAHAATDVTGFGISGHGNNLARYQKEKVDFVIHTLPVIGKTAEVSMKAKVFSLLAGTSAETSGGLLICMREENAKQFCEEIKEKDGTEAWIIGNVIKHERDGENKCLIEENPHIIQVLL
eukprot:TRINITY_DN1840_c0_g1_i1.p1 TRINITY_DN1840_c0_g1~~TRINITY_DN1840_c0_g1_i1.p1  ORF type:complete len:312 (+),score=74.29 TRINITY_DN1840_c0_g1_i1:300-1235(+)